MIDPQLVVKMYQELGTQKKVAAALGVSQSKVGSVLRNQGICVGRGTKQKKFDYDEILRLWKEHHDTAMVADLIGTSRGYVNRVLTTQFGIRVPRNPKTKYKLPMDELAKRYRAGETCGEIARDIGIPSERVRRRLKAHGVKIRSAAESVPRGKKNVFYKNGKGEEEPLHYYRRQSYEVTAICLGQPVPQGWVIHHVDENPRNNQPENLMLFQSAQAHSRHHVLLLRLQRAGRQVDKTHAALESGAQMLPLPPNPIELLPCIEKPCPCDNHAMPEITQTEFEW